MLTFSENLRALLTIVVRPTGTGKSVLLSSWAAARPAGMTCWLSCDKADADPLRFWSGFIQALRGVVGDIADLVERWPAGITQLALSSETELPPSGAPSRPRAASERALAGRLTL